MPSRPKLVFCGPSLPPEDRTSTPDLIFLPPAAQGSMLNAVQTYNPRAILLIDGVFQSEPSVRHKEILWILSQEIAVIGASSMGALRAAELYPHMQGIGLIYRWYRRYLLTPDDAVAVLHGPAEIGFAPLTSALLDLRMTIRAAWRKKIISRELGRDLEMAAAALNFRDRTLDQLTKKAQPEKTEADWRACQSVLSGVFVQQKRLDALAALRVLLSGNYAQPSAMPMFEMTRVFEQEFRDLRSTRRSLTGNGL